MCHKPKTKTVFGSIIPTHDFPPMRAEQKLEIHGEWRRVRSCAAENMRGDVRRVEEYCRGEDTYHS